MAPGRVKTWFKSLPLASSNDSHRARGSDASDLGPVATEATVAAASPVPAQIEALPYATTSSAPAYRLDSGKANEYMKNIKRFRVLVMGRANAGKTTMLQRVCHSTDEPEIFDAKGNKIEDVVVQGSLTRGYHNIEHELVLQSNPGFVFHDSCGFEAGSTEQFDEMKSFVVDHAAMERSVNKRIHAVWYCIPMTDCQRTVTAAEQKFFNECDAGYVPVIVLLTKCDALHLDAIEELEDEGLELEEVQEKIAQKERELLEKWLAHIKDELDRCKFPPRGYVALQDMDQENADCTALMQCTANVLNEEGLQRLLISTQQSSIALCVEYAVNKTLRKKMELGLKGRLQVDAKKLEAALLSWFPSCQGYYQNWDHWWDEHHEYYYRGNLNELSKLEVNAAISMPPLPKDVTLLGRFPTVQSIAEHAIGCLLVAEHSYFLMQHGHHVWKEVLSLAVEEYKISNMQATISKAVKTVFHDHNGDMGDLCAAIIKVIINNRLSNKLLMEPGANKVCIGTKY